MKFSFIFSLLFFLYSTNANSEAMTFELAGNGGNCEGCEWIKAEGIITKDTPARFREFGAASYLTVVLSSPGGNLSAGLELGRMFRAAGVKTSIGKTVPSSSLWEEVNDQAECNSACAYAFLGGATRKVDSNSHLGFHQFYDKSIFDENSPEISFSEQQYKNARDQYISGVIVNYLAEMGIDTRLYSLASKIGPSDPIRKLTREEAIAYKVDNHSDTLGPWKIIPFGDGLIAEAKTSTTKRRLRLYCTKDGNYYLTYFLPIEPSEANVSNYRKIYSERQNRINLRIGEDIIYSKAVVIAPVKNKNEMVVALQLTGAQAQVIADARSIFFEAEELNLSRAALSYYYQNYTIHSILGDPKIPKTIFRLCI